MYIQWCVKGICGASSPRAGDGLTWADAQVMLTSGEGIHSNWWRGVGSITASQIDRVLNRRNLDRHLHDYGRFGRRTPFISLAAGAVGRNVRRRRNDVYSAVDTALAFATKNGTRPAPCSTVGFQSA